MHLFNNCIDHGYLIPYSRDAIRPPIDITLTAKIVDDEVMITVEDFGAGVNVEKLIKKAKSSGLVYDESNPIEIVFLDGISSADHTTMTSGFRGVAWLRLGRRSKI